MGPVPLTALATIAWVGFVVFVYVFAAVGETFVTGLDDRVGEVVAARAKRLENGYRFDEAIAAYREALAVGFQNEPELRIYTLRDFMQLLESQGRIDEAIEAARTTLELRADYDHAYLALLRMLRNEGRTDEAFAAIDAFHDHAERQSDRERMARAKFDAGMLHETLSHPVEAKTAYTESFEIVPAARTALRLGELSADAGDLETAAEHLMFVLNHGNEIETHRAETFIRQRGIRLSGR